jgi:hypothetical protein
MDFGIRKISLCGPLARFVVFMGIPGKWTFEGNQTTRRLISFKVSGRSFQGRFFARSPAWVELTKKPQTSLKRKAKFKTFVPGKLRRENWRPGRRGTAREIKGIGP